MPSTLISLSGGIILVLGLITCLYWQVRFLAVAYNRSHWWFLGCLFVPFVDWFFYFLISRLPLNRLAFRCLA